MEKEHEKTASRVFSMVTSRIFDLTPPSPHVRSLSRWCINNGSSMSHVLKVLIVALVVSMTASASAQQPPPPQTSTSPTGDTSIENAEPENAPEDLELEEEKARPGTLYMRETSGDWSIRCIRVESGEEPCELYQLLRDENGQPVAEMTVGEVNGGGQVAAGATVITPLETLLTQQVSIAVDGGAAKRYPFSWCSRIGCVSRIGLTESDLNAYRRGAQATVTIVPVVAPDQKIDLPVSLIGFTAGFEKISN